MGKRRKNKKGKATQNHCNNCRFDWKYDHRMLDDDERENDCGYCARLQEPLTLYQKVFNRFKSKYLDGVGSDKELKGSIRYWIYNEVEFSKFAKVISKVIVPCPGFEPKE